MLKSIMDWLIGWYNDILFFIKSLIDKLVKVFFILGLNNIKANDYCNVILHALSHVQEIF